ncbi:MAG TPA: hypothetical protein VMF56_16830 [Acidobacteriaceae bacterium]|nr:hypothetical protein [Acidobacteriaceae bacterium]
MKNVSKSRQASRSSFGISSRRAFLQGMGATGIAALCRPAWSSILPEAIRQAAYRAGKKITFLNDGGFEGSAWGWQFTRHAAVEETPGKTGPHSVGIHTESGDYARFLVLEPEVGKTYTLSGWIRTNNIVAEERGAGAYFTASQFEFQGRPTQFSVDGKQIQEERYGNFTGSTDWQTFSHSFLCLPTTDWFEIVVGVYRASGNAWFSDLTFVQGDQPADLRDVVDYWQAAQWAHADGLRAQGRTQPATAILRDNLPIRGAASDPHKLARGLSETHSVEFLTADQLANSRRFNRTHFDLLVLPYGESFPLPAWPAVESFLAEGGDLFTTGGYAFQSPLVTTANGWEFYDDNVQHENGPNLLPDLPPSGRGWNASDAERASIEAVHLPSQSGSQPAALIHIPPNFWDQTADWSFDLEATGDRKQFFFEAWIRAADIRPAPNGYAYIGVEQLDSTGEAAYAAKVTFEELRTSSDWHKIERLFYLIPTCVRLRVRIGLSNATGSVWGTGFRLEHRSPQIRINTALGFPQDDLQVSPTQIGMFDADFRLKRVAAIQVAPWQSVLNSKQELTGAFDGYAASAVLGMNHARWIPLLRAVDAAGNNRGAAGAMAHNTRGAYARGTWVFFGINNHDIFSEQSKLGADVLKAVSRSLANECFLHGCETNYASYKSGESVAMRVLVSNYGRHAASLTLHWAVLPPESDTAAFQISRDVRLVPGQTEAVEISWKPTEFSNEFYRVTVKLLLDDVEIDQIETGFNIWKPETLAQGLPFYFKHNYFQVHGRSLFLQGTDDYLHTFLDQSENTSTWHDDVRGCRDSCIDVYENLMGLRGPQQRPTETWWRWIDAMLLNTQRNGGAFFPGLLIFSNTAVDNKDLADQQAYVEAFAARYKDAAGIIYYLNGDLELHDPNLPDLQVLYHQFLKEKYGTDQALRDAWKISPPEAPIGKLTIHRGTDDWRDVRTVDDFRFRSMLVERWLNALYDSIRKVDTTHPVTAEFYQTPSDGIDLVGALGKLELANFGYFADKGEDYYRFPQVCRFLDQSVRGKGINVGEFGVKTHPAWNATGYYIEARTEEYEQAYFLAIAHYAFALGASKIQNWCWKYPVDLPFEWGINYPNELVGRDVRAFYRNSGLLFRRLRPRYETSDTLVLLASENRMGGQGDQVIEGQLNSIRLLLDERIRFATLSDQYMDAIPEGVTTIFYPLPYCPSDAIVERLSKFVDEGGQLYISGDLSYDAARQRTRTERLKNLCGVEFVSERFPNIAYQKGVEETATDNSEWPKYMAAPGIVTRLAGAKLLLAANDGTPIVTEFKHGKGRVIFSSDPIELHGDPRYQEYAHRFYRQLASAFNLKGEQIEPKDAPIHVFRVPSQDSREIVVLVNYEHQKPAQNFAVPFVNRKVKLTLRPWMTGVLVGNPKTGIQAVESSANVFENDELLIESNLHFMAISFGLDSLRTTQRMLILPMGEGLIRLPQANQWHRPVVLAGQVTEGRWKQDEQFIPAQTNEGLALPINAGRSLCMLILCESGTEANAIRQIESWVNAPWELD